MENEFKVGDEVECVDNGVLESVLTRRSKYINLQTRGDMICIVNDAGSKGFYLANRFRPVTSQPEYFSALNEKDAEKYIGKVMEFADRKEALKNVWERGIFTGRNSRVTDYSFGYGGYYWQFCRTCPETVQKKMVKKTVVGWLNIYDDGEQFFHASKWEANDNGKNRNKIACVKLTGEYEIEG